MIYDAKKKYFHLKVGVLADIQNEIDALETYLLEGDLTDPKTIRAMFLTLNGFREYLNLPHERIKHERFESSILKLQPPTFVSLLARGISPSEPAELDPADGETK